MKHSWLKVAAVVAGVIFGANGSFAAENVWAYYAKGAEGNPASVTCIVQGDWILSVNSWGASSGYLKFSSPMVVGGTGVLDLQDVKVQENGTGDLISVKTLDFDGAGTISSSEITEIWASPVANLPKFEGNKYLRRAYFAGDAITKTRGAAFKNCSNMTNLIMRCPNITTVEEQLLWGASITNEITELVTPKVQSVGRLALLGTITGNFIATNQTGTIETFGACTNVYLEGPNYLGSMKNGTDGIQLLRGNGTVQSLTLKWPKVDNLTVGFYFSQNATGVKELCVYMPNLTNVASRTFGFSNIEKVTALGPVLPRGVVGELMYGFPTMNANVISTKVNNVYRERGTFYCSRRWGWKAYAGKLTAFEEGFAPDGCFGVYTNASGQRRAWMVHLAQDGEPQGMCIRIQ
jgi:hypothetical protein